MEIELFHHSTTTSSLRPLDPEDSRHESGVAIRGVTGSALKHVKQF